MSGQRRLEPSFQSALKSRTSSALTRTGTRWLRRLRYRVSRQPSTGRLTRRVSATAITHFGFNNTWRKRGVKRGDEDAWSG
jgi:hypothetical protein